MPQTGYLSGQTTNFTSNVSIADNLKVGGTTVLGDALSVGTLTATGVIAGNVAATSIVSTAALQVGVGPAVSILSSVTVGVVAITATATKSTETTFVMPGARSLATSPFLLLAAPTSRLSDGVTWASFCSGSNVGVIRFSNVSTDDAAMVAQTWRFVLTAF